MKNSRANQKPTKTKKSTSTAASSSGKRASSVSSLVSLSSFSTLGSPRNSENYTPSFSSNAFRSSPVSMRRNIYVETPHMNPRLSPQQFYKKLTEVVLSKEVIEARRAAEAKKALSGDAAEVKPRRKMGAEKKYYVQWAPHPNLERTTDVQRLTHYLYDHSQRLKWYQSKITKLSNHHRQRAPWRIEINKEKKTIAYIENKLHELQGTSKYKRLIPENVPQFEHYSPFVHQLAVVERIPRDYDYPGKDIYEPLARAQQTNQKNTAIGSDEVKLQ